MISPKALHYLTEYLDQPHFLTMSTEEVAAYLREKGWDCEIDPQGDLVSNNGGEITFSYDDCRDKMMFRWSSDEDNDG